MTTANDPWGRVDADGTVYVRTADGERVIGSWAAGSPEEAIAFFRRKFESLETEVTLIEQRITTTDIAPAQAQSTVQRLLKSVADANALATMLKTLHRLSKPTIARVHGAAFGGGVGLVACCDIAVGELNAIFALSEARLGLIPATIAPYVVEAIGARAARAGRPHSRRCRG